MRDFGLMPIDEGLHASIVGLIDVPFVVPLSVRNAGT